MRVLAPVVEIAALTMFHPWQDLAFGGTVALELIRDDHPWHVLQSFAQLAKELLRGLLIAPALYQDMEDEQNLRNLRRNHFAPKIIQEISWKAQVRLCKR
jgi:hypothetical protein